MRTVTVTMRDEVLEAAKKNAQLAGMPVGQFLAKVIEQAVSPAGKGKVQDAFRIADELGLKGPRTWKREDLYDG
ncbi:MAG: hypothetical protein HZC36_06740 [Armatimonadetes bacterium]|nr:hypothetical protein [Armatimonadota bacterium]